MDKEILEGNRLIAEFMGLVGYNEKGHPYEYGYFHQRWDYLMPVVEKINDTMVGEKWFRTLIAPTQCTICVYASGAMSVPMRDIVFHVGAKYKMIDAIWECVILFIKWYNTNSLTTKQEEK